MASLLTVLRRILWLVALAAAGGLVYGWWRDRSTPAPAEPPAWPPLEPEGAPTTGTERPADGPAPASIVNALVDTPDARSGAGDGARWVEPNEDGSCPEGFPIKANDNSGIFHVPGGRFYDRTKPERCYADPDAAVADGYRRSKQ
jgi:hypothetical protein